LQQNAKDLIAVLKIMNENVVFGFIYHKMSDMGHNSYLSFGQFLNQNIYTNAPLL